MVSGPGRPKGSKTTTLVVEVAAICCPECGSYERTPYEWSRRVVVNRVRDDGTRVVVERRRKCRCLQCGEPRIEAYLQNEIESM